MWMRRSPLEILFNCGLMLHRSGWGLGFCISDNVPMVPVLLGHGPHLEQWGTESCSQHTMGPRPHNSATRKSHLPISRSVIMSEQDFLPTLENRFVKLLKNPYFSLLVVSLAHESASKESLVPTTWLCPLVQCPSHPQVLWAKYLTGVLLYQGGRYIPHLQSLGLGWTFSILPKKQNFYVRGTRSPQHSEKC